MSYRYFLKLDGVAGGSVHPRHLGSVELEGISFDHGVPFSVGAGNGGGGRSAISDVTVIKRTDPISTILSQASFSGRLFREATLTIERSAFFGMAVKTVVVKMTSVIVYSVLPRLNFDEITLNFDHLRFEHGGLLSIPAAGQRGPYGWMADRRGS